jgi:negative regulator of sigma-B (phosphoserine phosphatase)
MAALTHPKPGGRYAFIEWGVAGRCRPGGTESGDRHLVRPYSAGVLLAAIDGLGHGEHAAAAARIATAVLEEHADEPVDHLVERCHTALARTRGVVMTLASVSTHDLTMSWLGVGNVEGVLARASATQKQLLLRAGVVGQKLPRLQPSWLAMAPGDMLLLATDGIRSGFAAGLAPGLAPQQLADLILARHGRETDDALALVARIKEAA